MTILDFQLLPEEVLTLRQSTLRYGGEFSFKENMPLASLVASLGMQQEVGTKNDEMARFIFDAEKGTVVDRKNLKASLIKYGKSVGVRIWAEGVEELEFRFPKVSSYFHPELSRNKEGKINQFVVFPEVIAEYMQQSGLDPVIVVPWAMNTIFGDFKPWQDYYQTNMWEMMNIEALRYAKISEKKKIAFLGTHDLLAHIAGSTGEEWEKLTDSAKEVRFAIERYFLNIKTPNLGSLILPYIAGIMLDDLAQPPCYGELSRKHVLTEVLSAINERRIDPSVKSLLLKFPSQYMELLTLARFGKIENILKDTKQLVTELVREVNQNSVKFA